MSSLNDRRQRQQFGDELAQDSGPLGEPGLVQAAGRGLEFGQLLGRDSNEAAQGRRLKAPMDAIVAGVHRLQRAKRRFHGVAHPLRGAAADAKLRDDVVHRQTAPGALEARRQAHDVRQPLVSHPTAPSPLTAQVVPLPGLVPVLIPEQSDSLTVNSIPNPLLAEPR